MDNTHNVPLLSRYKKYVPMVTLALLILISIVLWSSIVASTRNSLTVTFLNVGQGDAIFITTPSGKQVLIDGGRDSSVLRELGAVMPMLDRSIDMIVATHPDSDHITGLIKVLQRFHVTTALQSGVVHKSAVELSLESEIRTQTTHQLIARRGQVFDFGDGAKMYVLFPDRDASEFETNTGSVVVALTYGATNFIFTGDSPKIIEKYLVSINDGLLTADVLKAGHHGSKTASSEVFVGTVSPTHTVFSRGCNNKYGHPHQETIDTMQQFGIKIYDTCTDGRVVFSSDGTTVVKQ